MKLIKIAGAAVNQTPFDWDNNKRNIVSAIAEARVQGVSLLCLPELSITGYGCEDDFFRHDLQEKAWQILMEITPETKEMIVSVGLPVLHKNKIFNCAALIVDGKVVGLVAKKALANDGIHYETRQFETWPESIKEDLKKEGKSYPIGDIYFRIDDVLLGFEICEEAWTGRRPGAELAAKGVDIFLNPSASHFAFGKFDTRKRLVLEGSRAFGASYLYVNLLGNEAGRIIYDGGTIIAHGGEMMALGQRFSYADYKITSALVDIEHTRMSKSRTGSFKPELASGKDERLITVLFTFPEVLPEVPTKDHDDRWEHSKHLKEEEFTRAIALGLFDYLRKSKQKGFAVSLSGGADSAAVACLVKLMIDFAVGQLGLKGFIERLGMASLAQCKGVDSLTNELLICAYQATQQSSQTTREAAAKLAQALNCRYFSFDIDQIVQDNLKLVSQAIGRELSWHTDDIALQNIQARARAPVIWLLANIFDCLLLSTSNRSEGAVGYCTMDGDTAGSISPIAGIDKCFLRTWLSWLEHKGPEGFAPIPALKAITEQAPTAELRPLAMKQTDEKDLMPYDILNLIEDLAIEDNRSPLECYELLCPRFPQYAGNQLAQWIEKFFKKWSLNQWKRERFAPALHCDTRNLDPRTWRRSPILSGGYKQELEKMWSYVKGGTDKGSIDITSSASRKVPIREPKQEKTKNGQVKDHDRSAADELLKDKN